ncbi:hypothetical protein [Alkalihalobacterium bogoriense]|uniref:hypothetical protein n=1 Tax=Alkalihalobacterium bogoriense TaxID=246272 RepID=UPI000AE403AB|nr:hypothetical protein [Alkalihalobacterium bogoriense]
MNFEIFFALIGIPGFILITAIVCYVHTGVKEEISTLKKEIRDQTEQHETQRKGGISS